MRNYIQQFYARIDWDVDINPPNPVIPEHDFLMNGTDAELQQSIDLFIADLTPNPVNENIRVTERGPIYWLLDKANLDLILQYAAFDSLASDPRPVWLYQGSKTPRSGWTDEAGVDRKPPPSEKTGAKPTEKVENVQLDALSYLELLLATWELGITSQGRRLGGVLVPARWIDTLIKAIADLKAKKITPAQALAIIAALK